MLFAVSRRADDGERNRPTYFKPAGDLYCFPQLPHLNCLLESICISNVSTPGSTSADSISGAAASIESSGNAPGIAASSASIDGRTAFPSLLNLSEASLWIRSIDFFLCSSHAATTLFDCSSSASLQAGECKTCCLVVSKIVPIMNGRKDHLHISILPSK